MCPKPYMITCWLSEIVAVLCFDDVPQATHNYVLIVRNTCSVAFWWCVPSHTWLCVVIALQKSRLPPPLRPSPPPFDFAFSLIYLLCCFVPVTTFLSFLPLSGSPNANFRLPAYLTLTFDYPFTIHQISKPLPLDSKSSTLKELYNLLETSCSRRRTHTNKTSKLRIFV